MRPDGDAPVYVISVAAKLTGLPAWMLRLLDVEGIVVPTRTDKNRRLYSDNDLVRLERIRYLTEVRGVNMAGVKVILELERTTQTTAHAADPPEGSAPVPSPTPEETDHDMPRRR